MIMLMTAPLLRLCRYHPRKHGNRPPRIGPGKQGRQNGNEADQSRYGLLLFRHRKLAESARDEGTAPASPPPAGTQIWPTMVYTIGRHSPVRIGCRIRIVSCCWIVGRSINIRHAWTTQHQFPTTRIPRGKRLADRKRPRIGLCAGRRSAR